MSEGVSSIGSCMSFASSVPANLVSAEFAEVNWQESKEVTNIGDVGPENEVITFPTVCDGKVNKRLGATNFGQQALLVAFKKTNTAQIVLKDGAKDKEQIAVREVLSSGDIYYYAAYVASFKTQVGGSSDYLRAAVTLEIDSEIVDG